MSVWDSLVGQDAVVTTLQRAVGRENHAMTHAWLFTGPPGSGRSVAASAFAAALECGKGGCGTCQSCLTALAGTHPDVTRVRTEQLSIGVDEVRSLVKKSAMSPAVGKWQVLIVEDADRVTERGADALLKAIEEPSPRTVWMLCAPTADDVVVTIRSRSRQVNLVTPSDAAVCTLLESEGIAHETAQFAAHVAQGHIGRARAIALYPDVGERRREILALPGRLMNLGECLDAAAWAVNTAQKEAAEATQRLDAQEKSDLLQALGVEGSSPIPRGVSGQVKDLEDQQSLRAKRLVRDSLDSVLRELTSYYRDILTRQLKAGAMLVNSDMVQEIDRVASTTTPEATLRRIDAITDCRTAISTNVAPQLAFEALMVSLA